MDTIINKPNVSKWIGGMYVILTIFVLTLFTAISFQINIFSKPFNLQAFFAGLMTFIFLLMSLITISLYKTKYAIKDGILHSWSPFAVVNLKLSDIKNVERTMVPFHFRVGASFYSGMFYVPGLGWVKSIITNIKDGVLITTKHNKLYLITPSNPDRFAKYLKK